MTNEKRNDKLKELFGELKLVDKIKLLLIDDEVHFLEASKLYLESLNPNLAIITCSSAKEALKKLSQNLFDVIVSDYMMKGMNGLDLLARLRAKGNTIPFIIFTGQGREEVAIQALNLGADFWLQKGGDSESQFRELINLIEKSYNQKQAEEKLRQTLEQQKAQFHGTPVPVYIYEKQGDDFYLVDYNNSALESTGSNIKKFLGIQASENTTFYPQVLQGLRRCYQTQKTISDEITYIHPSTQEKLSLIHISEPTRPY